jgi:retinol-binding protein 3
MTVRVASVLVLVVLLAQSGPVSADAPAIPDTPAGRAFAAWLDAFNSGDRERRQGFLNTHPSWMTIESIENWNAGTGNYELLAVQSQESTNVFFHVKGQRWGVEEVGRLEVDASNPMALATLGVRRIPAGARFVPVTLDKVAMGRVVDKAADLLGQFHVDAKTGKALAVALRKRARRGDYRGIKYGEVLAKRLTDDLRELGRDRHLEVRFSYAVPPPGPPARDPSEATRALANNCYFAKAEHLEPNIGYLKLDAFAEAETCAPTASAAITFLADSDALILDLRDNNGGRGSMVEFLASYFFAERTHLSDGFRRADNVTTQSWTFPYVPGKKFLGKPLYVLISSRTFSAGEGLAFVLQESKRATLVGEATVGGSGTIEFKSIDDHFSLVVPTGSVISPVTQTTWAGSGVVPDIQVPASDALEEALRQARARP